MRGALRRACAIAVLAVASAACGGGGGSEAAPTTPPSRAGAEAPARISLGGGPDWLATDDRWLYVKLDRGAVVRIDPRTAKVAGVTEIGGSVCQGLGAGFGAVWACKDADVVRIDPARRRVVATVAVAKVGEQGHLVTGLGHVWVITGNNRTLRGIDPATNQPGPSFDLPVRATELAIDDEHLWAISPLDHAVVRINTSTGAIESRVNDLGGLVSIAVDAKDVFVATPDRTLQLDKGSLATVATIEAGPGGSGGIAVSDGTLWIWRDGALLRRDAGSSTTTPVDVGKVTGDGDVRVSFSSVWASANDDGVVLRVSAP